MSTATKTLNMNDLTQFTGSENWYRHPINPTVLYTDGASTSPSMRELTGCWMR